MNSREHSGRFWGVREGQRRGRIGHDRAFWKLASPRWGVTWESGVPVVVDKHQDKGPHETSPGAQGRSRRPGESVRREEGWVFGTPSLHEGTDVHSYALPAKEESNSAWCNGVESDFLECILAATCQPCNATSPLCDLVFPPTM